MDDGGESVSDAERHREANDHWFGATRPSESDFVNYDAIQEASLQQLREWLAEGGPTAAMYAIVAEIEVRESDAIMRTGKGKD
jgi:hypothetical protein